MLAGPCANGGASAGHLQGYRGGAQRGYAAREGVVLGGDSAGGAAVAWKGRLAGWVNFAGGVQGSVPGNTADAGGLKTGEV